MGAVRIDDVSGKAAIGQAAEEDEIRAHNLRLIPVFKTGAGKKL